MTASVTSSRAYAAYILGTGFFLYAFVQRVSPSVMTGELMREFNADGTTIGALSSMYFYTYAAIQIPVGVLIDRYGPRKLLAMSAVVSAVASLGFALSPSVFAASISRAFIGASVAFAFVGTLSIASTFFKPARFAMLAGILLAVGMAGAIVGQAPLRLLVELTGWRGSYYVLALWALVMSALAWLVIPSRPLRAATADTVDRPMIAWPVFSNLQTWVCGGIGFGLTAVMLAFGGLWSVPWLTTVYGLPTADASLLTSTMFIGWMIGSPIAGWLSDRIQRRKPVLIAGALLSLLSFAIIILLPELSRPSLSALYFLSGLGGGCMVVCFGLVREWNTPKGNATAIGFANMCVVASGALLQPLVGRMLDNRWQGAVNEGVRQYPADAFQAAFIVLLVVLFAANLCIGLVKESYCQAQVIDHN
ncbi:MAG: MFS transporter [Granulosicoccaceae bacterium]